MLINGNTSYNYNNFSSISDQESYSENSPEANTEAPSLTNSVPKKQSDSVTLSSQSHTVTEEPKEGELSKEEKDQVSDLKQIDAEVKAHEMAHLAAAGGYARGMSIEYEKGPDGGRYAVAGEVGIDTSGEDTPEKTISKMQTVMRAALAPAKPSGQDRSVAAAASKQMMEAQAELAQSKISGSEKGEEQETQEMQKKTESNNDSGSETAAFNEIRKGLSIDIKG